MADEKININYTDNYNIKDFAFNVLAPKYFEGIDTSKLAIGSTGYVTEQISNITEDVMNTVATLMKEVFPNRAQLAESIYSHAAIFQLSTSFANPSKCTFIIMLRESEIIEYGEYINGFYRIFLDANTKLVVEDKIFVLDYDIVIKAQKHLDDWIFSAQYDTSYINSISQIVNPYIKVRRGGNGYIGLFVDARRYTRDIRYENITNNSKINAPVLDITFEQQLAGFDIFYKSPLSDEYEQIEKRLIYTRPIKSKFCYYKLSDDGKLTISFSNSDLYFQPEFNSTLKIVLYLTNGKAGNFKEYNGTEVTAIATGETYTNNEDLFIATKSLTASIDGTDQLDKDALQNLTVEGYSTAMAITTDNDIETYFNNYKYRYGNEIKVIKMRDDIKERLYSSYIIMKKDDYIYPTNTSYLALTTEDFDIVEDNGNRFVLKAGHLFKYMELSKDTMNLIPNYMAYNELPQEIHDLDFCYTNMFTIVLNKKPNVVGFYMTLVNQSIPLDFAEFNDNSFIQFIINSVSVVRDLNDRGEYIITISVMPSASIDNSPIPNLNTTNNNLRIIGILKDSSSEAAYLEFIPINDDEKTGTYTFQAIIKTDDYITSNNKFRCLNLQSPSTGEFKELYVPMIDCTIDIYTLYNEQSNAVNKFENIDQTLAGYQITNKYSTESEQITFIRPMNMMRSTVVFSPSDVKGKLNLRLSSIPWIKYDIINDKESFDYFVNKITQQYKYLSDALLILRNTSHIDLKFYNTYGKSKNFVVGDEETILDKVNLKIRIKIAPKSSVTNVSDLIRDLKIYIKNFIEQRNDKGYNSAYISNLIRKIETDFPEIDHMRFLGVNDYPCSVQMIRNITEDYEKLTKEERRSYIPEFLVCNTENVIITLYED